MGSVITKESMEFIAGEIMDIAHASSGQRKAVSLCFFRQRTQKEAARELGISSPAVSAMLSKAARRRRKKYLPGKQEGKAVGDV